MKCYPVLFATVLLSSAWLMADEAVAPKPALPAFEKMKSLVGLWEGKAVDGSQTFAATARFALIADKSVLAAWLGEGTPYEMVTMIHPDGADLIATHYCAAHNQPRMVLQPGDDPNRLLFKFRDGTNIAPGDMYMQQVTFILDGPDHHIEEWVSREHDKETPPARFDFHRKP